MKIFGLQFKTNNRLTTKPQVHVSATQAKFSKIICISLVGMMAFKG
jgi:hypothetical protein